MVFRKRIFNHREYFSVLSRLPLSLLDINQSILSRFCFFFSVAAAASLFIRFCLRYVNEISHFADKIPPIMEWSKQKILFHSNRFLFTLLLRFFFSFSSNLFTTQPIELRKRIFRRIYRFYFGNAHYIHVFILNHFDFDVFHQNRLKRNIPYAIRITLSNQSRWTSSNILCCVIYCAFTYFVRFTCNIHEKVIESGKKIEVKKEKKWREKIFPWIWSFRIRRHCVCACAWATSCISYRIYSNNIHILNTVNFITVKSFYLYWIPSMVQGFCERANRTDYSGFAETFVRWDFSWSSS